MPETLSLHWTAESACEYLILLNLSARIVNSAHQETRAQGLREIDLEKALALSSRSVEMAGTLWALEFGGPHLNIE